MEGNGGIIDVHAHILPGADDGSRDLEESLELLKLSWEQGVRGVIATPHYVHGSKSADGEEVRAMAERLEEAVQERLPGFRVYAGQEIRYFSGMERELERGRALTLGEGRCVLTEFEPWIDYERMYQSLRSLIQARYYPVLAHMERYECLRERGRVEGLSEAGVYLQMNYASLSKGRAAERMRCRRLALSGEVHVLGSDLHRLDYRPPRLEKALVWLRRRGGEELTSRLTRETPLRILEGNVI